MDDADTGIVVEVLPESTGDRTFYAKWNANTYLLSFDANGGAEIKSTKEVTFGLSYGDLPTPRYEADGYSTTFKGWFTAKTGD